MDNTIIKQEKAEQQDGVCFICNDSMIVDDGHLINLDGEVTALICWKCYERNIDEMLITERGGVEDDD